jgi:hypothetical protein
MLDSERIQFLNMQRLSGNFGGDGGDGGGGGGGGGAFAGGVLGASNGAQEIAFIKDLNMSWEAIQERIQPPEFLTKGFIKSLIFDCIKGFASQLTPMNLFSALSIPDTPISIYKKMAGLLSSKGPGG